MTATAEPTAPPADDDTPKTPARKRAAKATTKAAAEAAEKMEEPDNVEMPEEREQWFRSPGFQRMRTEWSGPDADQMRRMQALIEQRVFEHFTDAFAVMNDLYEAVREQEVNEQTGEILTDMYGFPVWRKDPRTGAYIEDWTVLTHRQKEDFLFRITSAVFEWEQRAESLRTEALFAKAIWTEHFSIEYDKPMSGTIDDRNAVGNVKSAEDRYFALMMTSVSRRADAVVRTMNNLALRLRDTITQ